MTTITASTGKPRSIMSINCTRIESFKSGFIIIPFYIDSDLALDPDLDLDLDLDHDPDLALDHDPDLAPDHDSDHDLDHDPDLAPDHDSDPDQ